VTAARQSEGQSLTVKYAVAIVFIFLVGVVVFMTISALRPQWDSLVVIGGLIGFLSLTAWQVVTFMKAEDGRIQARETYHQVNSRFDEYKVVLAEETRRLVREGYAAGLRDAAVGAAGIPIPAVKEPPAS
jgi:hypothetical protein